MASDVLFINVRRRQDLINLSEVPVNGKVVFIAESSTPELTEIKLLDDIRDLKLFKSSESYDVITGSKASIRNKLKIKGYKGFKQPRIKKTHRLYNRVICDNCGSLVNETHKRIGYRTFKRLSQEQRVVDSNIVITDTVEKCRYC